MNIKLLSALVGGLAVVGLLARPPAPPPHLDNEPLLPRAEFVHALAASVEPMVADYYWLQAIQALGLAHDAQTYRDVYFYVDLATDLDPKFYDAYGFGAVSVTYNLGHWNWVNTAESTKLIRKGLRLFPSDGQLRFLLAYNLMYYEHRFREAADIVKELSMRPHAPAFFAPLATRLYAQGGDFDSALAFAEALRDSAQDETSKAVFDKRIHEIQLERVLQQVDRASARFKAQHGRLAHNVDELVSAGLLPAVPEDPLGGIIRLDEKGRGESTAEKHRLEVYGAESSLPAE